jgi:uncharacterized protein YndB with AHSA1/START domain
MPEQPYVVTVERTIAAPPEAIFEFLADPARHREIDGSGTVRDAKGGSQRLTMGSTFGMSMKLGVPYSMVSTIIEFDEARRIAWQTAPPGVFGKVSGGRIWRYELEPVESGTLVRETWDVSQEKGPIKRLLASSKSREHTRESMDATLAKIETLVIS